MLYLFQLTSYLFQSLGNANMHLSNLTEAKSYLMQSLSLRRILLEKNTLYTAIENMIGESMILGNLGNVYMREGQNNTALEYYTKSMEMMKIVYGENVNQCNIAINYDNIGNVHMTLGNYDTALECYTKSLKIKKDVYGEDSAHPDLTDVISFYYRHLFRIQQI